MCYRATAEAGDWEQWEEAWDTPDLWGMLGLPLGDTAHARIRPRASGFSPPVESDLERRPVPLPARPAPLCPRVIFHRCRKARKCNYGEIALRQTSTSPGLPGPIPHLSPDCGRQPHICMCFAEGWRGCGDPSHSARGSPQSGEAEAWGQERKGIGLWEEMGAEVAQPSLPSFLAKTLRLTTVQGHL